MKKSLRNLAKVAAGLGAAYAISKMGKKDVSAVDTGDLGTLKENELATESAKRFKGVAEKVKGVDLAKFPGADDKFYDAPIQKPFITSPIARVNQATQGATKLNQASNIFAKPPAEEAKEILKGRRMMSGGGSVVARGNKLARSKPTKLF